MRSRVFEDYYIPEPMSGCWLWLGGLACGGYGRIQVNGVRGLAHRYSYTRAKGPIPDHLQIDHLCRMRCCVNPEHLEAVVQPENMRRGVGPSALNARKLRCTAGHTLNTENTRMYRGKRYCRVCRRLWQAEYRK